MQPSILIIGYGNPVRRDDGLGPRIARHVERWRRPGVTTRALAQLTPELAAELAQAGHALFVDADPRRARVTASVVEPAFEPGSVGHCGDPGRLLAWSLALYGRRPTALLLSIPSRDTDFGAGLSAVGRQGMREALLWIRAWLDDVRPGR